MIEKELVFGFLEILDHFVITLGQNLSKYLKMTIPNDLKNSQKPFDIKNPKHKFSLYSSMLV